MSLISIDQRRLIVRSKGALERASKTIDKKIAKEKKAADKQRFHLQAKRFASMEGVDCVNVSFQGEIRCLIHGINDIRRKILTLFGQTVAQIYQISPS